MEWVAEGLSNLASGGKRVTSVGAIACMYLSYEGRQSHVELYLCVPLGGVRRHFALLCYCRELADTS